MNTTELTHPSHENLAAFNSGRLGLIESAEVERHLADCQACCRLLKTLPNDTLISLLGPQSDTKAETTPSVAPEQPAAQSPALDVTIAPGEFKTQSDGKPSAAASTEVPSELNGHPRYRIQALLGRGGMGSVFRAEHRVMNRPVALKVIDRHLVQTPGLVERFHREVQAAAKLSHPNIVTAYDAEQAGDLHFLVMELVEGQDLAEVVRQRGKLPVHQACEYVRQAALGLQHASERKMVHRDIKPQNLMLQASPDASAPGVIKILDFGLAQFATEIAETSGLTQVGAMMGTPDYMAPEQARDAHSADIRADIYSLGCTLYCLLSGGAPFPQGSIVEKIMAHVERQPVPLQELRQDVPPGLATVLAKMMAKLPTDRFQTPAEVAEALLPFASSDTAKIATEVVSPITKATARKPRSPLFIATSILTALAMVMLLGVIVIVTDQGRIEVRSEVDDVKLLVKRGGQQIDIIDVQTGSKARWFFSGEYELELQGNRNDIVIRNDGFQLTRWGKQIVTLTRKPELKGDSGNKALAELAEIQQFKGHQGPVRALAWLPDGKMFLSASGFPSGDKTLRIWNRDTGREVRQLKGHLAQVYAVDVNGNGDRALAVCNDKTIHLWNLTTGEHLKEIRGHSQDGTTIIFCPDGRHALFASHDKTVKLLDLEAGTVKREFKGHTGATFGLAFLPGNRRFLSGSWDGTIRLWNLETGESLRTFAAGQGVWEIKILPDGARFLSAGEDGTVQLWEINTGKQLRKISAHSRQAFTLDVSPDGRFAASGGDGLVCLWDVESGERLARAHHSEFVWDVEFAPDGGSLLSAGGGQWKSEQWQNGEDWIVRQWRLPGLQKTDAAADRIAAQYVLSIGGTVRIEDEGYVRQIVAGDEVALPAGPFALTYVSLVGNSRVTDEGLSVFQDCTRLTSLYLQSTSVSNAGVAHFKNCRKLKFLDLGSTQVSDAGLASFRNCVELQSLNLGATLVGEEGLTNFKNCRDLRTLYFYNAPNVNDLGVSQFQRCSKLTFLHLHGTKVTDVGLANFKGCAELAYLQLGKAPVGDSGLANFAGCKKLRVVCLESTQVSDVGLASFQECRDLEHLALDNTTVGNSGLTFLKDCKYLIALRVPQTKVTAAAIDELKKALPQCKIDWNESTIEPSVRRVSDQDAAKWVLSLGGSVRVLGSDRDIQFPADLPEWPALVSVNLSHNVGVSDASLVYLKDARHLARLDVSGTPVTTTGLKNLAACLELKNINACDTQVDAAGAKQLSDVLPGCKVSWEASGGPAIEQLGWVQLLNGKDTSGWMGLGTRPNSWMVKGGNLIVKSPAAPGNVTRVRTTRDDFTDFHLRVEAKYVGKAGSLIVRRQPDQNSKGYSVTLNDVNARFRLGTLTNGSSFAAPVTEELTKTDEWFTLEVIFQDYHMQTFINGKKAADYTSTDFGYGSGDYTKGAIGIDSFSGPGQKDTDELHIRKMEIKELPPLPQGVGKPVVKIPVVSTRTNLITDPSLEATAVGEKFPTGWGSGNLIPPGAYKFSVAEGGRTGKRGWLIEGDGQYAVIPTNRPGVDRALRYAARGWVRLEAGSAQLKILYFDSNGRYIGENRSVISIRRGWHQLTMRDDLANQPDARYLSLALSLIGTGKAVFDDLEFTAFDAQKLPANFEQDYASTPKHDPALFDRWAGCWESTTEYKATATTPAKTIKGESVVRKVLDDQFLLWQWKDESGDSQDLSLLGFDENVGTYRIWVFGSTGEVFERAGPWEAPHQLVLDVKSPTPGVSGVSIDRFADKDRIESLLLVKDASGQVTRDMRATWVRKAAPLPAEIDLSGAPAAGSTELALVQKMAGDWTLRSVAKPSVWEPTGKTETFTEHVAWTNGGKFLLFRSYDDAKRLTSLSLMTYEPKEGSYHFWTFAKGVYGGQWRITWDASSRAFHWRSIDMPAGWIGTGFNRWIDDDTFDNQALIKDENGRVLLDSTQEKRRKK